MNPITTKEKIRFVKNSYKDLCAMGERHHKMIEDYLISRTQAYEEKMNRLMLTLPKEFLDMGVNEVESLGDRFPDVVEKWESQRKDKIMENVKGSLKNKVKFEKGTNFSSPKTPSTPRLKLGKRHSLSRVKKYNVYGIKSPSGKIRLDLDSLVLSNSQSPKNTPKNFHIQSTGPTTRSRKKKIPY